MSPNREKTTPRLISQITLITEFIDNLFEKGSGKGKIHPSLHYTGINLSKKELALKASIRFYQGGMGNRTIQKGTAIDMVLEAPAIRSEKKGTGLNRFFA